MRYLNYLASNQNKYQDINSAKFSSSIEKGTIKKNNLNLDFTLYGILWEHYVSKNTEQLQSLLDYYNIDFTHIFFSKKMDVPLDVETIYQKKAIQAIEYELHRKYVIFDGYIPSKKIILEMKLSTFGAIGLKDIAYLYYFKDYQLHFLFFIPSKNTASINNMFVKRIKQLVANYNRFLKASAPRLDINDVLGRVKLITRSDLPNFPDLNEEFIILERALYSPPYICNVCPDKEFSDHYALVDHIHSKHDPQKIPCPECDEVFASKRERLDHLRKDHGGKQTCDICGKETQNKKALTEHMYQSHNQRKCEECGKVCKSPKALLKHRGRAHKNGKFICQDCNKVFSILFDLTKHKSAFHSGEQSCDLCGKIYKNKQYLYQHKSGVHSGEQTCDICGTLCKSKYALRKHKKRQHSVNYQVQS